eukprot:gene29152-32925_t
MSGTSAQIRGLWAGLAGALATACEASAPEMRADCGCHSPPLPETGSVPINWPSGPGAAAAIAVQVLRVADVVLAQRIADSQPQLMLTVTGGYDEYDYQSLGGVTKGKNWSVGGSWRPSGRTSVQLNVGKRYFGDSYFLAANHRTRTSVWSLTYSDAVTTTRSQFQLPSAVNTFALLDQLFQAQIPDAAARRQAVEAYIIAAGL